MKIFFTKKFREVLNKPYKQIQLGKYKLRGGTNVGFSKITSENVTSRDFLSLTSPTSLNNDSFYTAQLVEYNGGLQISFEIPETDASIYEKDDSESDSYYQIFLFYFTDVTDTVNQNTSLAFLVFEDFKNEIFSGLNLTSRRNIITTPEFDWKCNLILNQSNFTEILENPWGYNLNSSITALENKTKNTYISTESWSKYWVSNISNEGDLDWAETVYINNFGLKIY